MKDIKGRKSVIYLKKCSENSPSSQELRVAIQNSQDFELDFEFQLLKFEPNVMDNKGNVPSNKLITFKIPRQWYFRKLASDRTRVLKYLKIFLSLSVFMYLILKGCFPSLLLIYNPWVVGVPGRSHVYLNIACWQHETFQVKTYVRIRQN